MDDDDYAFDDYPSKYYLQLIDATHAPTPTPPGPPKAPYSHIQDDPPPAVSAGLPSMGWDTLVLDHGGNVLGGHNHRHRAPGIRNNFPPVPFIMGSRDPLSSLNGMFPSM